MEFLLLAKVVTFFNVGEKIAYIVIGLFMGKTGIKYIRDYRHSIEDEKL